ncbi:MAG: hypothetical protein KAJ19_10845, partial [Gammaproteobacteria bacterium]|nr:hypothetical protein [Gammaproteobacteria bacterium]
NVAHATYSIKNDEDNITTYFVLYDSNGDPCTALTVTNIDLYYQEYQLAQAAKADATALAAADSTHVDNKAFHCGNGVYRVDWPDAAFDAGIGKPVTLIVTVPTYDIITTYLELVLQPPVNVQTVLEDIPFDGSSDTIIIADNGITAAKIAADAIGASEIASNAIGVDEFTALNAVTTTIGTANTARSFTLTDGVAVNGAFDFHYIIIEDADDNHYEMRLITTYTSAKVVTVDRNFRFTPVNGDKVRIMNLHGLFWRTYR